MEIKNIDFLKVLIRVLELIILKPLTIPLKIYRNALLNLSNSDSVDSEESNLSSDFPLYIWLISIFDALIAVVYPIGVIIAIIAAIQAPFKSFQIFIGILIVTYFYPLLVGLVREFAQISLKILLYLKIISLKNNTIN
ncbi:hypothetical protein [Maribacter cobaltidurans]|uniref:Uncharacterized protein n=1 Tax=Maribacter cobaltidurans TaxID=1178778 RepID=A0A223V7I1_9FLAO|nr:hypothetical protein [Maribacter cobaltidurans]ASV30809.1 hypothetical protein CJ263_11600 [Maribacter cobaltidurans]GGD81934.1 hypothetical protein GCM10011412_19650 [Maribacter cobaltidurans]